MKKYYKLFLYWFFSLLFMVVLFLAIKKEFSLINVVMYPMTWMQLSIITNIWKYSALKKYNDDISRSAINSMALISSVLFFMVALFLFVGSM